MAYSTKMKLKRYNLSPEEIARVDAKNKKELEESLRFQIVALHPDGKIFKAIEIHRGEVQRWQYERFWEDDGWGGLFDDIKDFFEETLEEYKEVTGR